MKLRLIAIATLIVTCATTAWAQLNIGTHETACDSLTNTFLCSIPEDLYGYDYTATVQYEGASNLKIDGKSIEGGFTFDNVRGGHKWNLTGTDVTGKPINAYITFTFIPIVEINGVVDKIEFHIGQVRVLTPQKNITSACKVKFRGAASNSSKIEKHNYRLKFIDETGEKVDIKVFDDLRNDNNWILDAGTLDRMRIRNRVLTDLWIDIAAKPYYSDIEPKALNASRGHIVEVFSNGEYQGLYNMCEPIDRKQMKLQKYDEQTGEIHGQLWKSANRSTTTRMAEAKPYNNKTDNWASFEVEYPDFDEVSPTDFKPLYDVVKFVAESSDEEFALHAHEYLDVPVLIDYYIFLQTVLAYDNQGKNMYWAIYDQASDKKVTPAIWDFDTSLGQSWKPYEYHPAYLTFDYDIYKSSNVDMFIKRFVKWNVNGFVDKARERYRELRKGELDATKIQQRFSYYMDVLTESGTVGREQSRWKYPSDLSAVPLDLAKEQAFINDWLVKRIKWLDEAYFADHRTGDANNDGVVDVADLNIVISHILGEVTIPDIYSYKLDVTGDMAIDIADVNSIINIILNAQ